ncbi:hypothetical protein DITRI_Ditri20bG0103500 [Diplodiscus trichospermus]
MDCFRSLGSANILQLISSYRFTKVSCLSVWQKLEEENREFFQAYYLRLMVKQQIMEFNKLLEQQVRLMHQIHQTGVSSVPDSNGADLPPLPQNSSCYAPENTGQALKQENRHHPMGSSLPNVFTNGNSSLHGGMHVPIGLPTDAGRIDASVAMLSTQSSDMGLIHGLNGKMIKSEAGYCSSSAYMFGAESNVLEARPTIGDISFRSVASGTQPLNEPLLDADISSFGFLGQIPSNFSLSDVTADLSQSSGISLSVSSFGTCIGPEPHIFVCIQAYMCASTSWRLVYFEHCARLS